MTEKNMTIKPPGFRLRSSYDVAFSPSGALLATTGKQSQTTLWDVRQRRQAAVNKLLVHPASIAFSPNGAYFAVKNTAGEIVVCMVAGGELVNHYKSDGLNEGCRILFSADSEYLIDGSWKGRIDIRRVTDLQPISSQVFEGHMISDASASGDRTAWAFVVSKIGAPHNPEHDYVLLRSWPFDAKGPLGRVDGLPGIGCARLSPAGNRLAVIQKWITLSVFDLETNTITATTKLESAATFAALTWSPDGKILGTVQEGRWTLHASDDLREVGALAGPYPCALDFSPDGSLIALGSWERGVVLPLAQILQEAA
jgi:WD40 repeat protein